MARQDDKDDYERWRQEARRTLDSLCNKLPRGSLSAGQDIFDPLDPNTWHAPDAPDSYRKDAVELYGITPDKVSDGLSQREKRELHATGTKTIESVSPERYRQAQRDKEHYAKASQKMWNSFRVLEPELAADPAAVSRAVQRLAAKNRISITEAADIFERHPHETTRIIAEEIESEGWASGSDSHNQPDHRTHMPTDGGNGGHWKRQPSDDEPSGMMEELKDFQRRTGWHR